MAGSTIVAAGDASAVLRASARPAVDSDYVRSLQSLMPAKRNFLQRLADRIMGRPAVRNEQVAYAALLQGRLQVSRNQRDLLVRKGAADLQGDKVFSLDNFANQLVQQDDADKTLAAFAQTVAKSVRQNPRQARHVLEHHGAAIIEREIVKVAGKLAGVDDAKARALARVAYTTMVASVALADEEGTGTSTSIRNDIEEAFGKFEAAGTITDKLATLKNIEHRIDLAVLLSPAAKQQYLERVGPMRSQLDAELTDATTRVQNEIEKAFDAFEACVTTSDKFSTFNDVEQRVKQAVLLSPAARQQYMARLEDLSSRIVDPDQVMREVRTLTEAVKLEPQAGELGPKLETLIQIEAALASAKAVPASSAGAIRAALANARTFIELMGSRAADLSALASEMKALLEQADAGAAPLLKLHEALAQIKDPRKYVQCKQALDRILATVGGHDRAQVLTTLSHAIRPIAKDTDRDNTYLLGLIDQGDADIIDMVFYGAQWHRDANALKLAALERGFAAQVAQIESQDVPAAQREARLSELDAAHERALLHADVQHSRRVVSTQLDAMFQQASADSQGSGVSTLFSALSWKKHRPSELPAHLFKATRPDVNGVEWLLKHAGPLVERHDLLIADWIRLCHFDPGTGKTDPKAADELIGALFKGPAQASKDKSRKAEPALDETAVRAYVAQGFKSLAEVHACRDHLLRFAKAFGETEQGRKIEEALFAHVKAQRVATALIQESTGLHFASAGSEGVAPAMASWFERSAPWVSVYSRPGAAWDGGSRSVTSRMAAGASAAARKLAEAAGFHDVETAKTGNAWVDQALQEVRAQRSACIDRLVKVADSSPRGWIADRAKRTKVRGTAQRAREAVRLNEVVRRKDLPVGQILAAHQARTEMLESIKGFSLVSLRREPASSQALSADDLAGLAAYSDLADLELLDALDAQEEGLLRDPNEQARASEAVAKQALKIAILQEIAAKGPDAKWTQLSERRTQVMERLRSFGIDPNQPGEPMDLIQTYLTKKFDKYAKMPLAQLCTEWDPVTWRQEAAQDLAKVKARVTGTGVEEAAAQARRERSELLERRIRELRDGHSVTIRFGTYHTMSVSPPIPIPTVSAAKELRRESSNGITVALENGQYTLAIGEGESSRKSLSLSVLSDLLSFTAARESASEAGHSFSFGSAEECTGLAAALANGDASHPALWGIKVERSQEESTRTTGALAAAATLGIADFGAELRAERGTRFSRTVYGSTESLMYERGYTVQAGAKVQLVADLGGVEGARGIDKAVRRTLETEFGLLKSAPEVVISHKVIGTDIDGALRRALPQSASASLKDLRAKMGDLGDGNGVEIFVRYAMTEAAQKQTRQALFKFAHLRAQAAASGPQAGRELLARAKAQLETAHQLMKKPVHFEAVELGWTARTGAAPIEQNRQVYTKFTTGEAVVIEALALETPYPLEEESLP